MQKLSRTDLYHIDARLSLGTKPFSLKRIPGLKTRIIATAWICVHRKSHNLDLNEPSGIV